MDEGALRSNNNAERARNDGAAAMVIMSVKKARRLNIKPLARIKATGSGWLSPFHHGIIPCFRSKKAFKIFRFENI